MPEDSNFKFRSKFNQSFTNCGSLHCTILKAFHTFKGKRAHKARDFSTQFFPENVENEMFKYNIKFTRAACWINSKMSNRNKNTTLIIFLFCRYYWLISRCNYWRSLMLWNSTSWIRLKLTVQIQLVLYPCDPFLINNRNMTGNSVEK